MILQRPEAKSSVSTRDLCLESPVFSAAQRASAGAALGNTRITFPVSKSRAHRWDMRAVLNEISSLPRVRKCGRVPIAPHISLKSGGGTSHAGYGGLALCGSVWACPVCAGKIAAHRKEEVSRVADRAMSSGAVVSLLTLTQRHHKGQTLGDLWKALSYAWNKVTSGRRWQELKRQLGMIGYIKATEVTHGRHGWHVHIHVLVVSEKDPALTPVVYQRRQGRKKTPYPVEILLPASFIGDRWHAGLAAKNVGFIVDRGGLDWQTAKDVKAVSQYIAKMDNGADSLAAEATLGAFKKARRGNRSPFQILADFIETGDMDDLALWHQWEKVSFGKRALTWSLGLRDWAGLNAEKTDEEIAEEDIGGETIAYFEQDSWKDLWQIGASKLLDVLDAEGVTAAFAWLDDHGISYLLPDEVSAGPPDPD